MGSVRSINLRRRTRGPLIHPLTLYRSSFSTTANLLILSGRTEITINTAPNDEIAEIHISIPKVRIMSAQRTKVMTIAATDAGEILEVANLSISTADVSISSEASQAGITIFAESANDTSIISIDFSFLLWEACSPLMGSAPYLNTMLSVNFDISLASSRATLVTIVTPSTSSPRSTQGNYALAYPSRLKEGNRMTNLYFRSSNVNIKYLFGNDVNLASPWVNLVKAGASAFLIFTIAILAQEVDTGNRFAGLLAAFLAGASVIVDLTRDLVDMKVYGTRKSWIQLAVLGSELTVAAVMTISIVGLTSSPSLLAPAGIASLILATLALPAGILGLLAHSRGYWHGYVCDQDGCSNKFRWRTQRPECHYTGRVFCADHLDEICDQCIHGPDLRGRSILTAGTYGSEATPCGAITSTAS